MTKVNIITMGCSKNLVDSEQLAAQLQKLGFQVEHDSPATDFEIIFINTCGFIADAKTESIDTIFDCLSLKENGNLKTLVVFGCLSARYYNELKVEIPEVDFFCGNYNLEELLEIVKKRPDACRYDRILANAGHYAYLKISEGCVRNCAFCAIPLFKGKYVSRKMNDILDEAKHLAESGVKELILIAQDLCYYGYDMEKKFMLPELVEKLSEIEGVEWIRLHYLYPFLFPENLLEVMKQNPKVCHYVDIPVQHVSDSVLKRMNRGGTRKQTEELLNKVRTLIPDATIRTTLLVGFPGETDDDFNQLVEFVKEQKFDRLGVFTYSEEDGTKAAEYEDDVPEDVKQQRSDMIMEIQRDISRDANAKHVGKIMRVIVDGIEDENFICRTQFDSPEVDNVVLIPYCDEIEVGSFVDARIVGYDDYELIAEII